MITKEQAINEDRFHYRDPDKCVRIRRNGRTKLWKRTPERWQMPVKFGLYSYWTMHESDADDMHVASECPFGNL